MKRFLRLNRENITYLGLWLLLFLSPLLSMCIKVESGLVKAFSWMEVFHVWKFFVVYLVMFLVHNFVLAPLLLYKHRKTMYFATALCLVMMFAFYQCSNRPRRPMHPMEMEGRMRHRPMPEGDRLHEPGRDRMKDHRMGPPLFFGEGDLVSTITLVLLLGMNLGIKLYFRSEQESAEMRLLEKENLNQQLEYLKYQINPHFFMNTLNNIHALVDIDPEKAKTTIVELSKMMRYLLYEGNNSLIPLHREVEFLRNYITLMKLRYTDKVKIDTDIPVSLPDRRLPPLLLITFVENAFKHGVSYREPSFITIGMRVDGDRFHFECVNSKHRESTAEHGGVGLTNVRRRLDLIYGDTYRLDIDDGTDTYTVKLELPIAT